MKKETYYCIGVMSGTSVDGVDLAHILLKKKDAIWSFEIFECETVPYDSVWTSKLKEAVAYSEVELRQLNTEYTQLLGTIIADFIKKYQLKNLDAICSHGHTILHQPKKGITLQIGNLKELASICRQKVICNFRIQNVQLGGQGAPLVPIGDHLLFSEYNYCLNLGGFSNISFQENNQRIAFDIAPVNTVLNFYANKLGLDYDNQGSISRSGYIDSGLLDELNQMDYYRKPYPKSLGFEFVKERVLPIMEGYAISIENKLCTFTEHIAYQIGSALTNKKGTLLLTGGGAYNQFLTERIAFHLPEIKIIIPDKKILEFKEALLFGLLGILKLRNENNVLSSVTGSKNDHCSGFIYDYN